MIKNVKTVSKSKAVIDVVKEMASQNIGAIIVLDENRHTVGIFTERDLLKNVVAKGYDLKGPVGEVMTKDLVCAQLHDDVSVVPDMMIKGGFRHVPILDGFEPVGILSIRDILKHLAQ